MAGQPLLDVRDLRVEFPTRTGTLVALDGVSLQIDPGEILGVVGESGAGKSMTSSTLTQDIYAFIFDQKGLMAGLGIQGSKITKLDD